MLKDTFSRFRAISFIEGISFLILVFIAMPLKYFAGIPLAVKIVGMAHGVLFILFVIALYKSVKEYNWQNKITIQLFIYSLIPFGFIPIEKIIMKIHPKNIK
jgi:integral membrane protein